MPGSSVVPTRVGVNRVSAKGRGRPPSCPHARGGEPERVFAEEWLKQLSPRAWGGTAQKAAAAAAARVAPTRVGVNRSRQRICFVTVRCPHARGGEPILQH